MKLSSTLKLSFISLRANKTRTLLTVLGMVIGIAAVIVVFSAGEGVKGLVLGQLESFGTDIISTEPRVPSTKTGQAKDVQSSQAMAQGVQITTLKLSDMDKLDKINNIRASYAAITGQSQISYQGQLRNVILYGVSSTYLNIDKSQIAAGSFYTEDEDRGLAQVVVLGSNIKEKLFGDEEAVGKSVQLKKSKYRVIGVMAKRGGAGFISLDDFVYVPIRTLQKKVLGVDHVLSIVSQLKDPSLAYDTAAEATLVVREAHKITDPNKDDFRVQTMAEVLSTLNTITNALTLLLLALVSISLVVGGVGITNIMYVVVTERTAEIGLRKAVGARVQDILWQFLTESVLVTLLGGALGTLVGIAIAFAISWFANNIIGINWRFVLPLSAFLTAGIFSFVCGIAFGLYPARRAAKLDPIAALRAE